MGAPRIIVFLDIDGTMTDERGRVPAAVMEALQRYRARGFRFIPISGNGYPMLVTLAYYLPFERLVVAENGGLVGYRKDFVINGDPLKAARARRVLLERCGDVIEDSWQNPYRVVDLAFKSKTGDLEEAYLAARAVLKGMDVAVENSGKAIHVRDAGVDKGVGVRVACSRLGVDPGEVIAVGDSEVDVSMFRVAGYSIALGHSPNQVKDEADHVTDASYYRGLLEALAFIGRRNPLG